MKKQIIIALLTLSLISCNSNKGSKPAHPKIEQVKTMALFYSKKTPTDTIGYPTWDIIYKVRGDFSRYDTKDSGLNLHAIWYKDSAYYVPVLTPILDSGKQRLDSLKQPISSISYVPALPNQVQWDSNDSIYHPFKFPKK